MIVRRIFLSVLALAFWQCASQPKTKQNKEISLGVDLKLDSIFNASKHWMGFSLYDLENQKSLYDFQSDKFFTPASTTKLWTYYTVKQNLTDSIPLLRWHLNVDTLFLQGVANPSLLHPTLGDTTWVAKLPKAKHYCFVPQPTIPKFGSGWAWDDYQTYFQPERSATPVYGNTTRLTLNSLGEPELFPKFAFKIDSNAEHKFSRKSDSNFYTINPTFIKPEDTLWSPFIWSKNIAKNALGKTLGKRFSIYQKPLADSVWNTIYQTNTDPTFLRLLVDSDNFVAEQLLLMTNFDKHRNFDITSVMKETQMWVTRDPETNRWVDGSGLSRYNLFSPKSFIQLLKESYRDIDHEELFHHLAIGGYQGTLTKWYYSESPFVVAKTGTLSNNHNLAGYLLTKKGKVLAFSWMNNHYMSGSYPIKELMQKVLTSLRNNL